MAAPVRYLSGRQQQQKIGIEGSTQNEKVLEVVGQVGIGTTIFEPSKQLDVRGDVIVSGELTVGDTTFGEDFSTRNLSVSGVSTFTGAIDANGSLDVDGHTELDDVNVSGVSTFTGAIDANGSLDVDGHTELDDVNVSGASTFASAVDINNNIDVSGTSTLNGTVNLPDDTSLFLGNDDDLELFHAAGGNSHIKNNSAALEIRSDATTINSRNNAVTFLKANASGLMATTGIVTATQIDLNGDIDVDGHTELDDVNISGILTATTLNVTGGGSGSQTNISNLNVTGVSTFASTTNFNDIDVDGHTELDNLNVSGVSTFVGVATFSTNDVYVAQRLFVGGVEVGGTTNTFAGINTFTDTTDNTLGNSNTGAVQLDGGLGVDKNVTIGAGLSVAGNAGIGSLNVAGVSTFVGLLTVTSGDVYIAQRLFVGGLEVEGSGSENTFTGINTFTNQADNTLGDTNTGSLQGNGGLGIDKNASFGDKVFVQNAIGINSTAPIGQLDVNGHTELDDVNVSGAITATTFTGNLAGTVNTAAQPNITSLGTLGSLTVSGDITANGNIVGDNSTNISGINQATATTFVGNLTGTATIAEYTSEWNITSNGSSDYRFTGPGFDGTENDPTIYLTRGEEYKFTNNMGAHPFQIRTAINGSAYNDGITNNGVSNGTLTWDVQMDAPNVLYYQCTAHAGMVGKIYIGNSGSSIDIDGHIETDTLNVSGLSTFTGLIDANGGLNVSGGPGLVANTIQASNLNDGRVVLAAGSGQLSDNANLTFDGSTFNVTGHTELDNVNVSGITTISSATINTLISSNTTLFGGFSASGNASIVGDLILQDIDTGSAAGPELKLYRNSASPADADYLGQIKFAGESDTGVERNYAKITGKILDASNTSEDGILEFAHIRAGSQTITGRFRSDSLQLLNSTNFSVDGTSTFTGNVDANGGLDVSGSTLTAANGLVANSAQISDLTSGRVVLAGTSGELEDNSKLTFNGTTLTVAGDASFNGNVTIGGTLTSEDKTNVDSIGLVTARSGVRISAGGLVVTSGVSTFTDNIIGNLTGTATTATNLAGGDTGDIPYQSANGTTTFVDATGVGQGLVLLWNGSAPIWSPVSGASGNFGGITLQEEGSTVGSAGSVIGLNFVGDNITATAPSGIANGTVTLSDTPTFDSLKVTGITTIPNVSGVTTFSDIVNVGTGITFYPSSGIISATKFFGSGENLTDLINQRIEGIRILDEGVQVGSGTTFTNINFVGNGVVATGIGTTAIVTITDTGFEPDAQQNLYAGTNAGAASDADTCANIALGCNAGCLLNSGDCNIFLGKSAGNGATGGSYNIGIGCCTNGGTLTGTHNVSVGSQAGKCLTSGTSNVFLGHAAGQQTTTCINNVFLGSYSGKCSDGSNNVALGACALQGSSTVSSNTGGFNVAIGGEAGKCISTGANNIFLGCQAGIFASTGSANIFLGACASGGAEVTGDCNISFGYLAGKNLTSGSNNIVLGNSAGCSMTNCNSNVFIGYQAGNKNDGGYNIFFGYRAGKGSATVSSNTGGHNIAMGMDAGETLTTGTRNVFLGLNAGYKNTEGSCNVFLGNDAGCLTTTGCDNVYIGQEAGKTGTTAHTNIAIGKMAAKNATGCYNTVLGSCAGRDLTGYSNVVIGQLTGIYSTGACGNVFLGAYSAQCTSGNDNVILGSQAGRYATTGCYNVFFGKCTASGAASNNVTGNHNIAMGCEAGKCLTSGTNNIFLGQEAGKKIVDGVDNVAIGQHAGCALTSGCGNVFLGSNAGCTNTSGDSNIAIGCQVSLPSATGDKQLAIGNGSDRWIAGDSSFNVTVSTASTFSSDGLNVTGVVTATDFNATSDARLKTNVQVIPDPLDKIVRIDGVSFNWIKDNKPSMGVIADNIQEVLPDLVSDGDPKTVNYNGLIGLLIEVVKDQQTQINSLNERLSQLE